MRVHYCLAMVPVTTAAGLKCWETPDYSSNSNSNPYMNTRDMSTEAVVTEKECGSSAVSCASMGYSFMKMKCELRCGTELRDPKRAS